MTGLAIIYAGLMIYLGLCKVADALRGGNYRKPPLTPGEIRMREVLSRERKTWPFA